MREADTEGHSGCDPTDGKRPEQADPQTQIGVHGCQGLGQRLLMGKGFLLKFDRELNCTAPEYARNHWIAHFKMFNFMICEFYLNL